MRRPEIQGRYEARFEPVVAEVKRQVRRHGGGAGVCVYLEGEPVVDVYCGVAGHDGAPWRSDTMSMMWSATKGVTSTVLHVLASDGLLDYEAPVAEYWPEFAQGGKGEITVRQLMSHQAGLHRLSAVIRHPLDVLHWDRIVERLARAEPDHVPGQANAYHALTHGWLIGELVQRVAGQPFQQVLEERIVRPLGLDGMYVGAPDEALGRLADVVGMPKMQLREPEREMRARWTGLLTARGVNPFVLRDVFARRDFWQVPIPAMNGVATARSLARMYAALAEGGALDGVRVVSEEVVRKSGEVQTTRLDRVVGYPLRWRLGYHRVDAVVKAIPGAFGHFGLSGTGGWANPERRLAAAFLHNGNPVTVLGQARSVFLTGAVYRSLGEYKGVLGTLLRREPTVLAPEPK